VRRMQGNPIRGGIHHIQEHPFYEYWCDKFGCVPVAEPASAPKCGHSPSTSCGNCDPLAHCQSCGKFMEHGHQCVPSVDAPEAPRVRRMKAHHFSSEPCCRHCREHDWNDACAVMGCFDAPPADAAREQAVQALVGAVDVDALETIAFGLRPWEMRVLQRIVECRRAIPGK